MAGLNHGYKYRAKKGIRMDKEPGVFYSELSKKWVVKVKNRVGQISTLAQFDKEIDAIKLYNQKTL